MFACNGILFNHESPRRGETFVTRKITRALANMLAGNQRRLYLGNLDAKRDWGFAPEYVEVMWLMLQQAIPDDYVIATGESHSVREFCEHAFGEAGIRIEWRGSGTEEVGVIAGISGELSDDLRSHLLPGKAIVQIDPRYFRPTEVEALLGDATKARQGFGWGPTVTFEELVKIMVNADIEELQNLQRCRDVIQQIVNNKGKMGS